MSTEVLDLAAGTMTAFGLYTGHPELEALGALMAVVAGGIEMTEQSEPMLSADTIGTVSGDPELNLWHGIEHQINDFQTTTPNLTEASDYAVFPKDMTDNSAFLDTSTYLTEHQRGYAETIYPQYGVPNDHSYHLFGFL